MQPGKIIDKLLPYLYIGIAVALLIGFLIILSYVFIWGVLIGVVLYLGMLIKERFFSGNQNINHKKRKGRVIEHDDIR